MTQEQLYRALAEEYGFKYKTARRIMQVFAKSLIDALLRHDRIEIRGLGSWRVRVHEDFHHYDPSQRATTYVKRVYLVQCKFGKPFRAFLQQHGPATTTSDE